MFSKISTEWQQAPKVYQQDQTASYRQRCWVKVINYMEQALLTSTASKKPVEFNRNLVKAASTSDNEMDKEIFIE